MATQWDGVSDLYEDDEPVETILALLTKPTDVVTARPDQTGSATRQGYPFIMIAAASTSRSARVPSVGR